MKKFKYDSFDVIDAKESEYLYTALSQLQNTGKGLFTMIPIWEGEIISLFKGELLSPKQAVKRAVKYDSSYYINMHDGYTMDSRLTKCFAKFANDAEGIIKSNFKTNSIITLDDNNNVCLVANRDIKAGEEVFCKYGKKYWTKFKADKKQAQKIDDKYAISIMIIGSTYYSLLK